MKYLVTTNCNSIPTDHQIFCLDGTPPKWEPKPGDYHADHHRPGGAKVQIEEMALGANENWVLIEGLANGQPQCIVTTQVDADACVAAAAAQLPAWQMFDVINQCEAEVYKRLKAIAHDCDHLCVPPELSEMADFAAQAVATLKQEGFKIAGQMELPSDRCQWTLEQREEYASRAFQHGTEWLIAAARGECPWPGENGEANVYWQQVQDDSTLLCRAGRIWFHQGMAICDLRSIGRYVDPRAFLRSIQAIKTSINEVYGYQNVDCDRVGELCPETLTIRDHKSNEGISYTLGCVPTHPDIDSLDYTTGTFQALTAAEARKRRCSQQQIEAIEIHWLKSELPSILGFDPWGGRATVGGSGWTTPSVLTPQEVVEIVTARFEFVH